MSNLILLYEANNLTITGEYLYNIDQECIGEWGNVEYKDVKYEYIILHVSVLVNGKLKHFQISFQITDMMDSFIETMQWMWYMQDFESHETSKWVNAVKI